MKLAMTLLVRDEIDIIEANVRYHLPKVDLMLITDNMSKDGTYEFLVNFQKENKNKVVLLKEPSMNYQQAIWVGRMINRAKHMRCDWVVNSDADEFWYGDIRSEVEAQASQGKNAIFVDSYYFVEHEDDEKDIHPIRSLKWRSKETNVWPKVINATDDFKAISQGNDDVYFVSQKPRSVKSKTLKIYHYSHRGWEHFKRKYVQGGEAYKMNNVLPENVGGEWRKMYEVYLKDGEEGLRKVYEESFLVRGQEFRGSPLEENYFIDTALSDELAEQGLV